MSLTWSQVKEKVNKAENRRRTVHAALLADGRHYRYAQLISTMPLPELIKLMGDEVPENVQRAAQQLQFVSVRCVNLGWE